MLKSAILAVLVSFLLFKLYAHYFSISIEEPDDDYDFVVVGGGTTGSVIANRLTENGLFKVLVLKAGAEDDYDPRISVPMLNVLSAGGPIDWNFKTESLHPHSTLTERNVRGVTRGKVLGGTSAINYQLYMRGSAHDYNSWAEAGAEGWHYEGVLPYFLKSETSKHLYPINEKYHGSDGPLEVSHQEKVGLTGTFIFTSLLTNRIIAAVTIGMAHA